MKKLFVIGAEKRIAKNSEGVESEYMYLTVVAEEDGVMLAGIYSKCIFENAKGRTGLLWYKMLKRLKATDSGVWEADIDDEKTWVPAAGEVQTVVLPPHYFKRKNAEGKLVYVKVKNSAGEMEKAIATKATLVLLTGETAESVRDALMRTVEEKDYVKTADRTEADEEE